MLFLLRKIRRKLLSKKNKVTSYLLYAIGEIFLVVIGILIAVSINNLNERIKGRELELKYLKNIKLDLEKDIKLLRSVVDFRKEKLKACEVILQQMRKEKEADLSDLSKSVRVMIFEWQFVPVNTTFMELSSSGNLNIISNDSTKVLLLELQNLYNENDGSVAHETFDYREYISKPMLQEVNLDLLRPIYDGDMTVEEAGLTTDDFHNLMQSTAYRNGVGIIKAMSMKFIERYQEIQLKSEEVISLINREIEIR